MEFFKVLRTGDVTQVTKAIENGFNVNEIYNGESPLVCTIRRNLSRTFYEIVELLVRNGADVYYKYPVGTESTPLILALDRICCEKTIKLLISVGSSVNANCVESRSALMYAIKNNYSKDIIQDLIIRGANVNHQSGNGESPLYYSVRNNCHVDILKMLINAGADVQVRKEYDTNLLMAVYCINCEGINCKYKAVIDFLVDYIDVKNTDEDGNTVIHNVHCNYLISTAKKNGLSIEVENNYGYTPLMKAYLERNHKKVKDLLVYFKANPNCVDQRLNTPLHYLSRSYNSIDLLLYHGADLQSRNAEGKTPLDISIDFLHKYKNIFQNCDVKVTMMYYLLFIEENGLDDFFQKFKLLRIHCLPKFIIQCKAELRMMRSLFFNNHLTVYDFCKLRKLYQSEFVNILFNEKRLNCNDIIDKFPIYKNLIITRIRDNSNCVMYKTILLNRLEGVTVRAHQISETNEVVVLPFDCLYLIGLYLNRKEIFNLLKASI